MKNYYAISGNAGWKVKPRYVDCTGWEMADFVFYHGENGEYILVKNRKDSDNLEFLTPFSLLTYIQSYYDFSCEGVDVHTIVFHNLDMTNRGQFKLQIDVLRSKSNRNVKYKELGDL